MFFSKTWDEVPGGSILHVTFTTSGPFVFGGEHVVDRGPSSPVLVGRLPSGLSEFDIPLHENENHIFKFDAGFAGQACTFEVSAKVKIGGNVHQQPFSAKHTLKNSGDMLTVKLATVRVA